MAEWKSSVLTGEPVEKSLCPEGSGSRAEAPNEVRGAREGTGFLTVFGTGSAISSVARVRHCEGRNPEAISESGETVALPEGSGQAPDFSGFARSDRMGVFRQAQE